MQLLPWALVITLLVIGLIFQARSISRLTSTLTDVLQRLRSHEEEFGRLRDRTDSVAETTRRTERRMEDTLGELTEMLNDLGDDARQEMKDHFGNVTRDQARRIRDILREVHDVPKTGPTSFERVLKDDPDDPV